MSAPVPNPTPFSRPLVSIEFDDGWETAYNYGLPIVQSFGWKPTVNIITCTITGTCPAVNTCSTLPNKSYDGDDTYMTSSQIKDWNDKGDIASHTDTHPDLSTLTYDQVKEELGYSKAFLDKLLGRSINLFATPYCASSSDVVSVAQNLYQSVRNCSGKPNTAENFDRWGLQSLIVFHDTNLTDILNETKDSNGWLILAWHHVNGNGDYSVSVETLHGQLQLVKDSGITVVTTQAALNESTGVVNK